MALMSFLLFSGSAVGLLLYAIQLVSSRRHLREVAPAAGALPPISILKPLCGLDDELADNLAVFAALPYPDYEVVLGVASTTDPAYAVDFLQLIARLIKVGHRRRLPVKCL